MYIHTFSVSAILSNERFYSIQEELRAKDPGKWVAEKKGMTYFGLSEQGIVIKMHRIKKKSYYGYLITYRISARRVIENDNYIGLFNTKNYGALRKKVDALLQEKYELLPKLRACGLHRLDFCINAELENQEQVKAYIRTAKRANVPSKLERSVIYDKVSKRKKPTKDDCTVRASEYVEISIYNKFRQMEKEKSGIYSKSEMEKAHNIVRIEIRCMEEKIKALKKKYGIETVEDFMAYSNKIGEDVYSYYLTKMFGSGGICTLKEAFSRIEQSGYRPENVDIMKDFISEANEARDASEAAAMFRNIYGKKELKRILWMFDNIDTNYVTVTNADAKLFENGYIPLPIDLYKEFINIKQ